MIIHNNSLICKRYDGVTPSSFRLAHPLAMRQQVTFSVGCFPAVGSILLYSSCSAGPTGTSMLIFGSASSMSSSRVGKSPVCHSIDILVVWYLEYTEDKGKPESFTTPLSISGGISA